MGFKKCPICELNYISEEESCCAVCKRAKHGIDNDDAEIMCIECGENPAVRGSDLCVDCLREARRQEKIRKSVENITDTVLDVGALEDMEVPLADDSDIPQSEMEEINKELDDDFEDEDEEEDEKEAESELD